ncbi:MAG: uncharacterized protein PWQ43_1560 [Rikenellaceae bacterium]|nr:uncharacterized protein [Rikenellaceae bacterium]
MNTLFEYFNILIKETRNYCLYLEEAGMIVQGKSNTDGIPITAKADKVYLDNSNLIYRLEEHTLNTGNIHRLFFFN